MKHLLATAVFLLLLGWLAWPSFAQDHAIKATDLQTGDLLFEQSTSSQAALIQQATHSKWTHVAIAMRRNSGSPMAAIESAGPVGFVSIDALLARSRDGCLVVMRLRDREHILTPDKVDALREFLSKQTGKPYDALFLWDDDSMYCSELVWKSFKSACAIELGKVGQWSELDFHSPTVMEAIKKRYERRNQPLDMDKLMHEKIITPAAIYNSPLLEEVGVLKAPLTE
jgi:hypothetical protein